MPRQNDHHLPDNILKNIFLNENVWIIIKISLKFVPGDPFDNKPAFVQIMTWRRSGAIIWTNIAIGHRRLYASLGLSVLKSVYIIVNMYLCTHSSFSTWHMASMDLAQKTARRDENLDFGTCCGLGVWRYVNCTCQCFMIIAWCLTSRASATGGAYVNALFPRKCESNFD